MPKKKAADKAAYSVVRSQDGALIVTGVKLDLAKDECTRLNREAAAVVGRVQVGDNYIQQHAGMYLGEVVRYEVRTEDGLTV